MPDDAPQASAEVLGRLLVIQQTLDALPNEARLNEFTREALMTVPGVETVLMYTCDRMLLPGQKADDIRAEWVRMGFTQAPDDPGKRMNMPPLHYFPLSKDPDLYGYIIVRACDEAALSPYLQFIGNLSNSIGNVLDSRLHFSQLTQTTEQLMQRTCELQASNRKLEVEIGERERAQAAQAELAQDLARSNRELEQLAYVASHDLQEPLRMIASYLQLLEQKYGGQLDADAHQFIAFAVDGAKRMQTLINDLLTYSRVGNASMPTEPVKVRRVVDAAIASLRVAISESAAHIGCGELPVVEGNASQLTQLFQNLLGNAIKFRGERAPEIAVTASPQDGNWCFSVRDNGIGIEAEYFDRIFVMFQRLHTRSAYPGTGIGLAICKKIVERHGGQIWVESTPGEGTVFHFTLPKPKAPDA